ncbi:leucyl aminopeptidase [Desulfospira joergensenii]|uniref:leucyl aminopeptidase n=1 Tax=Desulfospira joergensenii TaxID=53329 RepID=UPI0003B76324|nr:leucyl aminopeptidase [Desulfospira joergensenii]
MKPSRLTVTEKPVKEIAADLLVFCALEKKDKSPKCDRAVKSRVEKAFSLGDFKGKAEEELLFYPEPKEGKAKRILLIGLGEMDPKKDPDEIFETLREAGGGIAKACERTKAKTLVLCLPEIPGFGAEDTADALAQGILLGDYRFAKYKESTRKETDYTGLTTIQFSAGKSVKQVRKGARKGLTAARAACEARNMANEPGNGWTSKEFADHAKALAKTHGLIYKCLEKKELEKLGMGGILAVNQGSAIPPRLVILEYRPAKKSQTIMLVGKGITFDSGGISLKPAQGMGDMKYDMCGGAAVLSAMQAVGEEKPPVGVVALIPATDNMSGSRAVRPGDIIRHFNGVTSEVLNTDAEGRLVLADALAYGIKTYKPDCVIDAATLTGAVIIGLGHHHTGLVSNNEKLTSLVTAAGKKAGEPVWPLPLTKAYKKQIESKVADIKNLGGKDGGTITAAAYLSNFVDKTPWVHLDIAGTAWDFTEKSYIPKGPSGIAVRTFLNLIRDWNNPDLKTDNV